MPVGTFLGRGPRQRLALITILLGFTLLAVIVSWIVPSYLKQKIEKLMAENCPRCEFHLESIQVNPLKGSITFGTVKFVNDLRDPTTFRVFASQIKAWFSISELLNQKILIDRLEVGGLEVFIEEPHDPHPPKPNLGEFRKIESTYAGKFMKGLPEALIKEIVIENSRLEYILAINSLHARIMVSDINAEISPVATRGELGPRFVRAHLTGKVQQSGLLSFSCRADLFSVKNEDQIQIDIQHLPMPELDTFFTKEDGLIMGGEINEIHTSLFLTLGNLTGDLWANYKNLSIHIEPTPTIGPIKAFFENVIQNLKTAKTKPAFNEPPPRAAVNYQRKPGQSLVNFILQGLKEAAFKVIAN